MNSRIEELPDKRSADLDVAHPQRLWQWTRYGRDWLWQAIGLGLDGNTWRYGDRLATLQAFDFLFQSLETPMPVSTSSSL